MIANLPNYFCVGCSKAPTVTLSRAVREDFESYDPGDAVLWRLFFIAECAPCDKSAIHIVHVTCAEGDLDDNIKKSTMSEVPEQMQVIIKASAP